MAIAASAGTSRVAPAGRQRGVALAIVVWFIAGMSLLVAGIVAQARLDTRMAQIHVARAKAAAAGDGAIQLMMVDLMTNTDGPGASSGGRYRLGDVDVTVVLVPASGLIDINRAAPELLSALFVLVGGLGEDEARSLAETMVQSRTAGPTESAPLKLAAVEDLLRIPGASRNLLDAVRDFIVVNDSGRGNTDWSQTPEALLDVLAKAYPEQLETVRSRRADANAGPGLPGAPRAGAYRADALVRYGDKTWLRRRWLAIEKNASTALPWHSTRTEAPRVLTENSYLLGGFVDA